MNEETLTPASTGSGSPASPCQEPIEDQLAGWTRKLDRFLDQADRTVVIGRELVEQRALNIDLQRQIHRLEDELQSLRSGLEAGGHTATSGSLRKSSDGLSTGSADSGKDGPLWLSRMIRWIVRR